MSSVADDNRFAGDGGADKINKKAHTTGLVRRTIMNIPRFSFKREKDWIKKGHLTASDNVVSNVVRKKKSEIEQQNSGKFGGPRAAAQQEQQQDVSRRKTVVGMGKAKKFVVDGTGRGLPIRAFPDAATRRCFAAYCHKWGITQKMIEHLYGAHHEVIEGRYHYDGAKKKWYDYSIDSSLEIFDNHRVEMTAFIVLSHCYQKEFPGLPPHDGKDSRGVSFARYVIWSCEICRMKDYEMIDLFMKCLTQKPNVEPKYFMNTGMLPAFFEAIHRDFKTNKYLRYLISELLPTKENDGIEFGTLVRFAFKYPPLLYPLFDFQKMWRRKIFGERFWSERLFEAHERPEEYEDARSKYGIPSEDFNLFARIPTTKAAWQHTARNITLDLLAERSRNKVAPPWKLVSRIIAGRILKDRFGYQNAYFFMKLLDFREDHVVEKEEEIKLAALEEGELLYDEWLKAEFYHNPVTGISKWDNSYKKGATEGINFSLDLEVGPGGDGAGRRGSILKNEGGGGDDEGGEEEEEGYDYEAEQERRRKKKEKKLRKKKKRREREQMEREGLSDQGSRPTTAELAEKAGLGDRSEFDSKIGAKKRNEDIWDENENEERDEAEDVLPPLQHDHHEAHLLSEDKTNSGLHTFDPKRRRGGQENVLMATHDEEGDDEHRLDQIETDFAIMARRQIVKGAEYQVQHADTHDVIKRAKERKHDDILKVEKAQDEK